ncbi:putative ribosomal N-acetyltransferase YdaF [Pseudovibrio sp. Ad5]|uniref:GNAT family N-acetyltransferase n=1 Tax=Pseudovibrio sp. Ad5 TaxID=989436 RepID=UPI0007AEAF69|nr:GNAT family N-acetyltransferase [Pseudovibrio sp. Ad5]KZK88893.1 putative ribosomal N-acetyltransferase YdaF [Pseudovibrio sp. Ad5]
MTTQSTFPVLRSERLVLREMREADLALLCSYLGDFEVSKSLSSQPHPFLEADGRDYIEQALANNTAENVTWAIELDGQFCGGFKAKELHGAASVGYWLGREHWGKGLMSEALHLALTYLFQKRGLETLQTGAFRCNPASLRVLQKVGFVTKGLRTNTSNARGGEELEEEFLKVSIDQFRTESDEHSPFKDKELL